MPTMRSMVWSSVGKKVLMALTGLAMILFLVFHLGGNLTLLTGDPQTFNHYAHFLMSLSGLVIAFEIGLLLLFALHIFDGVMIWLGKKQARPVAYQKKGSAGGPSRKTVSSKTMIWTGLILLVFVVVHVVTFKYGPGVDEGYVMEVDGVVMRDLHRLVVEWFGNPAYVLFYVASMVLLGFHLRHAFWSAFQSLGALKPRFLPLATGAGVLVAIVLGFGFLMIPLWIFFTGGGS